MDKLDSLSEYEYAIVKRSIDGEEHGHILAGGTVGADPEFMSGVFDSEVKAEEHLRWLMVERRDEWQRASELEAVNKTMLTNEARIRWDGLTHTEFAIVRRPKPKEWEMLGKWNRIEPAEAF